MVFHGHAMFAISPQAWAFTTVMLPAYINEPRGLARMLLVNNIDQR